MAELLKNALNPEALRAIALAVQAIYTPFPVNEFVNAVMGETWDALELKARWRKISTVFGHYLPPEYEEVLFILEKALHNFPMAFFVPDFVEVYGQDDKYWDISVNALERMTQYWSAEFAVRPFIIKDTKRMMQKMYTWSLHENEHVRRLASEGCRPQLPWGQALVAFKENPSPILPILEQLKADPSLYVRKSAANNLNDISKTHPELVVQLAKDWYGNNSDTDWLVKHACRTLLKKGNSDVLAIFGYENAASVEVRDFVIEKECVPAGGEVVFSFTIRAKEHTKVRLEYAMGFARSGGKTNKKIFQISEVELKQNEKKMYTKKHSFKPISSRKYYPGTHSLTLIVNGVEHGTLDFVVGV